MTHLSIKVLGSLQVYLADTPKTAWESDKVRALLAYLAVESGRSHRREALVGLFWPDYPEESARHSLRQALFNLRSVIGDRTANPPYLLISRDAIQFNRQSDFSLDLDQFNQCYYLFEENLRQRSDNSSLETSQLEEMVNLYRGEFLQQFFVADSAQFEEWALVQRESSHQRVLEVHRFLANRYEKNGDFQAAHRHVSQQLVLDPWREEAHYQMMRVLALDGMRSAALAQYETCKRILAQELDVDPSAETRELYEQIRLDLLKPNEIRSSNVPAAPLKNLPVLLTPFVGRETELAQLGLLIANRDCRCITLMGPGGIGKTRLALQAAGDHLSEFSHGVAFVPLASVGSISGVIPAIANAINIAFYGSSDPKAQLLSYLSEKQILLILDNIEDLLAEDDHQENITQLLIEILQNAPKVKLMVTSREALNLQGEWLFELHGLTVPASVNTEGFDSSDAVTLFIQRARRAFPRFILNDENKGDVARICRLVEGMPLAIELAATWMRILSPAEIASEIEKSMDILSASVRDLPERHRSMRVVFDRSWQMLSTDEQQVLCKLSIFRSGFHRQAAEQIAGATLSILSTLVNRTLVRRIADNRYDLHELIRQYCNTHMAAIPSVKTATQGRHYDYYLAMAESAEKELKGSRQLEWLGKLEQDHDNLRAALGWALENDGGDPEVYGRALRLSAALRWFWRMRGHFHEGCDWFMEALRRCQKTSIKARASGLLGLSLLVNGLGDLGAAYGPAEESVSLFKELGDGECLAEALMISGLTLLWQGDAILGSAKMKEALNIYRKVGDRWGEAQALFRLGSSLADYGGDPAGLVMLKESVAILEDMDEKFLFTSVMISLGIVDMSLGDYSTAKACFERCLTISREINHPWGVSDALTNLGCIFRIQGEYMKAQTYFEEARQVYKEHGDNVWEADVLCAMSENAIAQGDLVSARAYLQVASDLLEKSDNKWLQVLVLYFQGLLSYYEGKIDVSAELLDKTVALAREGRFKPDLARSLVTLGHVKQQQGEIAQASKLIREGLDLFWKFGHKLGIAVSLEALANLSLLQGNSTDAMMLFAIAHSIREVLGAPLSPIDHDAYDSAIATTRARLGDNVFADLWARAAARPYKDVVEEILKAD